MEVEVDENHLKAAGVELFADGGRRGVRIHGWGVESRRHSILNSSTLQDWEQKLQTSHLPEMVFGENSLILKHPSSGTKIHFNAFDALRGLKQEALPPVEEPAVAEWKFRRMEEIFLRKIAIFIGKTARNKLMLLRWCTKSPYFSMMRWSYKRMNSLTTEESCQVHVSSLTILA